MISTQTAPATAVDDDNDLTQEEKALKYCYSKYGGTRLGDVAFKEIGILRESSDLLLNRAYVEKKGESVGAQPDYFFEMISEKLMSLELLVKEMWRRIPSEAPAK